MRAVRVMHIHSHSEYTHAYTYVYILKPDYDMLACVREPRSTGMHTRLTGELTRARALFLYISPVFGSHGSARRTSQSPHMRRTQTVRSRCRRRHRGVCANARDATVANSIAARATFTCTCVFVIYTHTYMMVYY